MTHQCDRVHVENSQLPIRFERALVQLGLLYLPSLRMQLVPVFSLVLLLGFLNSLNVYLYNKL